MPLWNPTCWCVLPTCATLISNRPEPLQFLFFYWIPQFPGLPYSCVGKSRRLHWRQPEGLQLEDGGRGTCAHAGGEVMDPKPGSRTWKFPWRSFGDHDHELPYCGHIEWPTQKFHHKLHHECACGFSIERLVPPCAQQQGITKWGKDRPGLGHILLSNRQI